MNILSIDYGKKRIGLAWVQTGLNVVLPYGQFQIADFPAMRTGSRRGGDRFQIGDFTKKEKIDLLVVGLPIGLDGKENDNTIRVRAFAEELKQATGLPVEFVDERFTTAEAKRMGGEATPDEKAAMLILESYLASLKHSNI